MKSSLFSFAIVTLLSPYVLAGKNYPCSGAPGSYRLNPDGSEGGFVATSATVDSTIHLDIDASICERATVIEGVKLLNRAEVSGRATVRGKVLIQERAKIYGEAYVINIGGSDLVVKGDAKVYGQGFLQGSVLVGDTSEIYGWGKVLDYVQVLGNSKVCGSSTLRDSDVLVDDQSYCSQK